MLIFKDLVVAFVVGVAIIREWQQINAGNRVLKGCLCVMCVCVLYCVKKAIMDYW